MSEIIKSKHECFYNREKTSYNNKDRLHLLLLPFSPSALFIFQAFSREKKITFHDC